MFEALFPLAGTVMPSALVHSWGRVASGWLPLLAGRRVPRWLLLGPAFAIGSLMTVYFTVTMVKITQVQWAAPGIKLSHVALSIFWVSVPGYIVRGLGLVVASFWVQSDDPIRVQSVWPPVESVPQAKDMA